MRMQPVVIEPAAGFWLACRKRLRIVPLTRSAARLRAWSPCVLPTLKVWLLNEANTSAVMITEPACAITVSM